VERRSRTLERAAVRRKKIDREREIGRVRGMGGLLLARTTAK
jgi:hypothetical protein